MGVGAAALVVEFDDLLQGGKAAVVHVRGGQRHAAQGGRLELAAVGVGAGDGETAEVERLLAPADAGVVVFFVGEVGPGVAAPAAALALVEPQTVPLIGRQRRVLAA